MFLAIRITWNSKCWCPRHFFYKENFHDLVILFHSCYCNITCRLPHLLIHYESWGGIFGYADERNKHQWIANDANRHMHSPPSRIKLIPELTDKEILYNSIICDVMRNITSWFHTQWTYFYSIFPFNGTYMIKYTDRTLCLTLSSHIIHWEPSYYYTSEVDDT